MSKARRLLLTLLGLGIPLGVVVVWLGWQLGLQESLWLQQRINRLGSIQYRTRAGWQDVAQTHRTRTHWQAEDAFLLAHLTFEAWAPGLEIASLRVRRTPPPHQFDIHVVRLQPSQWDLRVVAAPKWEPRTVAAHGSGVGAPLAVNASFFSDEGPLGLVLSKGQVVHRQATLKASHFLVDGPGRVPRIVNEKRTELGGAIEGFQGFPSIMDDGITYPYMRFGGRGFDVWEVERRTAACIDHDERLVLVVTDALTSGLAFDELATVLGGLGCVDAMGFDGGTSTSLAVRTDQGNLRVAGVNPVPVALVGVPRGRR